MDAQFWNERFSQDEYVYGTSPNTFLVSSMKYFPQSGQVLSLAEGEGRNAVYLSLQGYDVRAVDQSSAGQVKAQRLAQKHSVEVEYILSDLNTFDFGEEQWDAVISIFAHPEPAIRNHVFKKTIRGLKPGGIFLLESYHPKQLEYGTGGPKEASRLVAIEHLNVFFPHGRVLHQAELERDVREGACHFGDAYVTQFIWEKGASV
ncbi:MAG: class I SAM-dependent methyltransferase [Candidatus Omnitrophica bacterium]|nr:class I SAM-dependent methyltransferase [Candidatus Omnitrophota bacterium]